MEGILERCDPLSHRQFLIAVKRLADSLGYGTDRSPFLGSGIEFAQSRPYQMGDPIRSIDWRVTARTGKVFIKEYEAPKRMPVYLLLDTSASMTIGSGPLSKYAWAVQIAGGIALASLDRMSPVGIMGVGEREIHVKPSLSRDRIHEWLYRLRRFRYDETTSLGARVVELCSMLLNRALTVILSDLHDADALSALKLMAQRHDMVVLQLQDPAETGLPGSGLLRAREAETGEPFITHGRRQWLDQDRIDRELRRAGIDHLLLRTDRPFVARLVNFFRMRDRKGKGTR